MPSVFGDAGQGGSQQREQLLGAFQASADHQKLPALAVNHAVDGQAAKGGKGGQQIIQRVQCRIQGFSVGAGEIRLCL